MTKTTLKRIALPRTWSVPRKSLNREKRTFISRPVGKTLMLSVALNTFLKEILFLAKTKKEVKALLKHQVVLVNGLRVKDDKFPVTLFDVVTLESMGESFRAVLTENGKLSGVSIPAKEATLLLRRVEGKTLLTGNKLQVNLSGSANMLFDKTALKVGDSLIISNKKVVKEISLAVGVTVVLIAGRHIGTAAKVTEIDGNSIFVETKKGVFKTLKKYAFVVGEKSAEVVITK